MTSLACDLGDGGWEEVELEIPGEENIELCVRKHSSTNMEVTRYWWKSRKE